MSTAGFNQAIGDRGQRDAVSAGGLRMTMEHHPARSAAELMLELGDRLRQLRLRAGYTQATLADKAGISVRALSDLEAGRGSSLITFVRALKALGAEDAIESLAPEPTLSPMAMLRRKKARQRGYR